MLRFTAYRGEQVPWPPRSSACPRQQHFNLGWGSLWGPLLVGPPRAPGLHHTHPWALEAGEWAHSPSQA